ncbi:hypothetical protein HMI55_002754 [Coelomomyces lativittatus]|nr:hypothetical protein HMI55_002754 [Coelomomyces lativittatus]KAJ1510506.1 hypothetical protein HMI56_006314 [Coelomomyces lativittatus]
MRDKIRGYGTDANSKLFEKVNGDLLISKLNLFLDNPSKKTFDEFIHFSKKSIQSYIPLDEEVLMKKLDITLEEMRSTFENFMETTDEIFEASKNLKLHQWAESKKKKNDLKLKFEEELLSIQYTIFLNMPEGEEDLQFFYNDGSHEFQNIDYANELFHYSLTIFQALFKYVFTWKYHEYCSSYGFFPGVKVFSPSTSTSNPTIFTPPTEPYYRMRLLGVLKYENRYDKNGKELLDFQSSLLCSKELYHISKQSMINAEEKKRAIVVELYDFFKSRHIEKIQWSSVREFEENEEILRFLYDSFLALRDKIPNKYKALKEHLKNYFDSLPAFFKEVNGALSLLDSYNLEKKLKAFKPTSGEATFFRLYLQPNDVFFVEWSPVLDLVLLNDAIRNSEKGEEVEFLLKEVFFSLKSLRSFQQNYIVYQFLNTWLKSCHGRWK